MEGERARGEGKKVSFDMHENGTRADSVHEWNDERSKAGCVHVDNSHDGREDNCVHVPELVRELSNNREVQEGCDGGLLVRGSGASVENDDGEGMGKWWRRLVCVERAYR